MKLTLLAGFTLLGLIAMSATMAPVDAQSDGPAQAGVTQWEYKVINAPTNNGGFIQGYKLQPTLNELGIEGWECVGTISDVRKEDTRGHVILKRPKQ
ncbi:MAG: DUF4177 domain-containing protein [Planctomycetota bacterium]